MPSRTGSATQRPPTPADAAHAQASKLVSRRILILANLLRRAAALRYRRLLHLPAGEWGVIAELGYQSPRTLNELANGIGLDKTQLSRTVSCLVARRLVKRRSNPDNNREVLITLTRAGRGCYEAILAAGIAANERLLAGVSAAEQAEFVRRIEKLTDRARDLLQIEQELGAKDEDGSG
jgi:DNA-binding MarR family transcriptional regulator